MNSGNPAGPMTISIVKDSGGAPSALASDILASVNYNPPNAITETYVSLNSPLTLAYDTQYWIVWNAPNQVNGSSNYYNLAAAGYKYGGHAYRMNMGAWQAQSQPDVFFNLLLSSGDAIGNTSDSNFFTNMVGSGIKDYSLNEDWSSDEWAVINSVNAISYRDIVYYGQPVDSKYSAGLDRGVNWYDTEDVQLIQRITLISNNSQNNVADTWYTAAGLVFDTAPGGLALFNKSYTAERDIGIANTNGAVILAPSNAVAPLFASEFGNIYSTIPDTTGNNYNAAGRRTYSGLVYTQTGNVTFNYLCASVNNCPPAAYPDLGISILGNNVTTSGYIYMDGNSTRVIKNGSYLGSNCTGSASSWHE